MPGGWRFQGRPVPWASAGRVRRRWGPTDCPRGVRSGPIASAHVIGGRPVHLPAHRCGRRPRRHRRLPHRPGRAIRGASARSPRWSTRSPRSTAGRALALDDAVITLTQSWTGTAATSFRGAWTAGTRGSPSTVLSTLGDNLVAFSRELRDYADQLEHAQNEHWIQLGLMAALTVLNAAQGGADPATDAAEVAAGAGLEVAAGVSLTGLGELALGGALSGFGSDVLSQFGADLLDRTDPGFDQTGDDVVPVFDAGEAASSALNGALSEVERWAVAQRRGRLPRGPWSRGAGGDANLISPADDDGSAVDDSARPFSPDPNSVWASSSPAKGTPWSRWRNLGFPVNVCTMRWSTDSLQSSRFWKARATDQPATPRCFAPCSAPTANSTDLDSGQSATVFVDGRGSGLTPAEAQRGLQRWLGTGWNRISSIRIIGEGWQLTWP